MSTALAQEIERAIRQLYRTLEGWRAETALHMEKRQ